MQTTCPICHRELPSGYTSCPYCGFESPDNIVQRQKARQKIDYIETLARMHSFDQLGIEAESLSLDAAFITTAAHEGQTLSFHINWLAALTYGFSVLPDTAKGIKIATRVWDVIKEHSGSGAMPNELRTLREIGLKKRKLDVLLSGFFLTCSSLLCLWLTALGTGSQFSHVVLNIIIPIGIAGLTVLYLVPPFVLSLHAFVRLDSNPWIPPF